MSSSPDTAAAVTSQNLVACARCGALAPYSSSTYSEQGELLCSACSALQDLHQTDWRAAANILRAGYGSLGFTAVSFFIVPLSILAITLASGVLIALIRSSEYRALVGGHLGFVIAACVLSLVLSGLICLGGLLGLVLLATS